jgi:hypothetical protein
MVSPQIATVNHSRGQQHFMQRHREVARRAERAGSVVKP